jgi:alkylated DNA repair dioxygenase AlkB
MLVVQRSGVFTFCVARQETTENHAEGSELPHTGIAERVGAWTSDIYGQAAILTSNFTGAHLFTNFIDEKEERALLDDMNKREWKPSQSGRRKLDFGPSVNFKRKKVKLAESYQGLPKLVQPVVDSLLSEDSSTASVLRDFIPVECGVIEYDPNAGAAIERHLDDKWLWGERLVTLSLSAATTMTFSLDCDADSSSLPHIDPTLKDVATGISLTLKDYSRGERGIIEQSGCDVSRDTHLGADGGSEHCGGGGGSGSGSGIGSDSSLVKAVAPPPLIEVRVDLPPRSVLVMEGASRNVWEHAIHRDDVTATRVSITLRELATDFRDGGAMAAEGAAMKKRAGTYLG